MRGSLQQLRPFFLISHPECFWKLPWAHSPKDIETLFFTQTLHSFDDVERQYRMVFSADGT